MKRWSLGLALALVLPPAASAATAHADFFVSDDADDTSVVRLGVTLDWRYADLEHNRGIKLERAWLRPLGGTTSTFQRAYYRFADTGGRWRWSGQVGSDGNTLLGSLSVHTDEARRQEYFLEREILETPRGVAQGLYYTFAGAAFDLPLDARQRQQLTVLAGAQDFSGDNLRTHLRLRYTAVVAADWGLSAQLRTRAFRDSTPREYDYYAPGWFVEVVPALQLRRFHGGWMYSGAVGWGRQRDAGSDWRAARFVEAAVTSPKHGDDWYLRATAHYANTPVGSGYSYGYRQFTMEAVKTF